LKISVTVNGEAYERDVEPRTLLAYFLRDTLGLTGTHVGCDSSSCGCCVVMLDSEKVVKFCTLFAFMADGHAITTVEGLRQNGKLHPIQQAFWDNHGLQCGFCTPGMMMTSVVLLKNNPAPSEAEIREAISGNLCRCTGYQNIVKSVQQAAAELSAEPAAEPVAS